METFRIGLQKGSLNNPQRQGLTGQLLNGAGFILDGYESGKEKPYVEFRNFPEAGGVTVASQSGPELLYDGKIDALVAGSDWIREWGLRGKPNVKKADLGFGVVKIVVGVKQSYADGMGDTDVYEFMLRRFDRAIGDEVGTAALECRSEFPHIAMDDIAQSEAYMARFGKSPPLLIESTGSTNKNNRTNTRVAIKHVLSQTEPELDMGADYIVESMQSGRSFKEAGIASVRRIMESEAGFYVSPRTAGDSELASMADYFVWMLTGAKPVERPFGMGDRMLVKANFMRKYEDEIDAFVVGNCFCDSGPTIMPVHGREGVDAEMAAMEVDIPM